MTPPDPQATDLPRRCAACGYDLAGLPQVGRCPECGAEYDSADGRIVLLGWARGWRANGESETAWRKGYWVAFIITLILLVAVPNTPWWSALVWSLWIALFAADAVWIFTRRRRQTAGGAVPPGRAYFGPDGYGQADGVVPPALRPWGPDDEITVGPAGFRAVLADGGPGAHRYRLTVAPRPVPKWWIPTQPVKHIDFAFDATFAGSAAIRAQVEAWRDGVA